MDKRRVWLLSAVITFMLALPHVSALYLDPQQAPFSVNVDPEKTTAKPGDQVSFTIEITASSGFNESIALVLEVEAMSYYDIRDLGIVDPPYPKQFQHTVAIPEEVPASVTAYGTISASSLGQTATEEIEITIKSGNIVGDIIGWILGVIQAIISWFSNLLG